MKFWLVVGEYKYLAKHGLGVYVRAFEIQGKADRHRDWLQSVADKATSPQDDWCGYNFMLLEMDLE